MQVAAEHRPAHPWLRSIEVCPLPGTRSPLVEQALRGLLRALRALGHRVVDHPSPSTDVLLSSAPFGEPLNWRDAPLLTARRRFGLRRTPWVFTLVAVTPARLRRTLQRLSDALRDVRPDPRKYAFPGLAPRAWDVLHEQGRRGGPMLALARLVQAQAKSIRILLVVGERQVQEIHHFDLVGGHPVSRGPTSQSLFIDAALRMVTAISTRELTDHQWVGDPLPRELWESLETPSALLRAARELGRRHFFTRMVRVEDLVHVPAVGDAIAHQYSEGCFATWDASLGALITTVTGSARPVEKDKLSLRDLAVVVGVRPDGQGALVRAVEGQPADPPSSEAVEMVMLMEGAPRVQLPGGERVPAIRSILHGHRGVGAYDPAAVEFVPLDEAYYRFPVTCATEAQAQGLLKAFARSCALRDPQDPRQVVFTVLPTHGVVMVERWVPGKEPLAHLYELMDQGKMVVEGAIPQGPMTYQPGPDGRMMLVEGVLPEV